MGKRSYDTCAPSLTPLRSSSHHSGAGILSPTALSALYPPKNLPRGVIAAGLWCYEYAKDYEDPDTNPYAVGQDFGRVVVPFGAPEMQWTNGERSAIARKHLKVSIQPGAEFVHDGYSYKCKKYSAKGCHVFRKKLAQKAVNLLTSTDAPCTKKTSPKKSTKKTSPKKRKAETAAIASCDVDHLQENPRWVRCKQAKLANSEWNVLTEAISGMDIPQIHEWTKKEYMPFAARVLREYRGLQKSALHLNRM